MESINGRSAERLVTSDLFVTDSARAAKQRLLISACGVSCDANDYIEYDDVCSDYGFKTN